MQSTVYRILVATAFAWQLSIPAHAETTVNGTPITDAEVNAVLQASKQTDTPQIRQAIKNQLIARVVIQQAAERASYGNKPEVQAAERMAKSNAEVQLYLKDNVRPAPVSDTQVKARYDEVVGLLGKDEVKPRIIVTRDAATAAIVLTRLKSGQSFESLAQQYSQAPTGAAGGELPWISFKTPPTEQDTQGLPLAVAQAMARLPAGGVTPEAIRLGSDANGPRAIVKIDAKRPTRVPSFDAAQGEIRQQLQALALQKATADFVGGLVKDAKIEQ
ncbi:peptidyl-prolyl cis-trans isomerase [Burkholderia lata]|uniref:peptidylprolyl isomerase n=1 Tax=Burkholderia lata (strain ATCC 17760 / DSM 23089 / LMG 22485 / NCIMB 9086 / R18194 / 383) TaxID=482957 RepID=UPI001452AE40|nr:peptidylprolyl isomerase [Burkholderia lata]VWC66057.1 peptidyl-prolyl cis-trans isomerase [Burkholderia lata]